MKGTILDFSIQTNSGVISADDQNRYTFIGSEWQGERPPLRGDHVHFIPLETGQATNIHPYEPAHSNNLVVRIFKTLSLQLDQISPPNKPQSHFTPLDWFVKGLKNYFNISTRASRQEYGYFVLGSVVLLGLAWLIDWIIFYESGLFYPVMLMCLGLPLLTASTRRMHDIGRSGWLLILACVPVIGLIVLYWLSRTGQTQANKWGYPQQ